MLAKHFSLRIFHILSLYFPQIENCQHFFLFNARSRQSKESGWDFIDTRNFTFDGQRETNMPFYPNVETLESQSQNDTLPLSVYQRKYKGRKCVHSLHCTIRVNLRVVPPREAHSNAPLEKFQSRSDFSHWDGFLRHKTYPDRQRGDLLSGDQTQNFTEVEESIGNQELDNLRNYDTNRISHNPQRMLPRMHPEILHYISRKKL